MRRGVQRQRAGLAGAGVPTVHRETEMSGMLRTCAIEFDSFSVLARWDGRTDGRDGDVGSPSTSQLAAIYLRNCLIRIPRHNNRVLITLCVGIIFVKNDSGLPDRWLLHASWHLDYAVSSSFFAFFFFR